MENPKTGRERESRAPSAHGSSLALLQQSPLGEATLAGRHWLAGGGSHRDAVSVAAVAVLVWSPRPIMQLFQLPVCSSGGAEFHPPQIHRPVPCRLASRTP